MARGRTAPGGRTREPDATPRRNVLAGRDAASTPGPTIISPSPSPWRSCCARLRALGARRPPNVAGDAQLRGSSSWTAARASPSAAVRLTARECPLLGSFMRFPMQPRARTAAASSSTSETTTSTPSPTRWMSWSGGWPAPRWIRTASSRLFIHPARHGLRARPPRPSAVRLSRLRLRLSAWFALAFVAGLTALSLTLYAYLRHQSSLPASPKAYGPAQ